MRWTLTILALTAAIAVGSVQSRVPMPTTERLGLVASLVACGMLFWFALGPPVLRVDAAKVACPAWLYRQRVARSDLAFIFRGQAWLGRYPTWTRAYLFVAADGTPRMTMAAFFFTDDAMTELAQRVQVPVRGDFSVQVKDRVEVAH